MADGFFCFPISPVICMDVHNNRGISYLARYSAHVITSTDGTEKLNYYSFIFFGIGLVNALLNFILRQESSSEKIIGSDVQLVWIFFRDKYNFEDKNNQIKGHSQSLLLFGSV